jgi:hypothetical protein
MLFRLFPLDRAAESGAPGGPLFIPRSLQGRGRHDNPEQYGAFYASAVPVSVVAEYLRLYVGPAFPERALRSAGLPYAIAGIEDARLGPLPDLDDPGELSARALRPSLVATGNRSATQRWALRIYREGHEGFRWWSTIEASWSNVTLFAERAVPKLTVTGAPEPLTLDHPVLLQAAEVVGVRLSA